MVFRKRTILEAYRDALKESIESILSFAEVLYLECIKNMNLLKFSKKAKWQPTEKDETSIARIASFLLELMARCIDIRLRRIVYGDVSQEVIACNNGVIVALMRSVEPERLAEVGSAKEPDCRKLLAAMDDPSVQQQLLKDAALHADHLLHTEAHAL